MTTRIDSNRPVAQPTATPAAAKETNAPVAERANTASSEFKKGHTHGARCGCNVPNIDPKLENAIKARADQILAQRSNPKPSAGSASELAPTAPAPAKDKVIDVHFHVVRKGTGVKNGDVTKEQIDKQIKVLNDAYKGSGFQFRLASTDRTTNAKWYTAAPDSSAERQMKGKLHKGDSDDLNIYTTNPGEGLLGWATFPSDYKKNPIEDGVVLLHSSLPGGAMKPFNEGDTGTHEVGHWMGLFHTWNQDKGDGKGPTGDFVSDTPEHAEPNTGKAPVTTDTLPNKPGKDPVKNFMNYTDDDWMDHFTDGQRARMQAQFEMFRKVSTPPKRAVS